MSSSGTKTHAVLFRSLFGGAAIVVAGALAVGYHFHDRALTELVAPASPLPLPAAMGGSVTVPAVALPAPVLPSFDVVRVSPQGNAVIAGRAEPGAEVIVRDGDKELARARADRRGEFVALPAAPLPSGGSELTLTSRDVSGAEARSDGAVVVVVPPIAAPVPAAVVGQAKVASIRQATAAVAVLVPNAAPPRVLPDGDRREAGSTVSLDIVDYDETGGIRFTGKAAAGGALRVYVDNEPVGDQRADTRGRWSLAPGEGVPPGFHTLRVDQLDAGGKVLGRVEMPFQRTSLAVGGIGGGIGGGLGGSDRVVVQPGQNLWRLARLAYGRGIQYSVIYLANREQIKDPRLIYPGQAFAVPSR